MEVVVWLRIGTGVSCFECNREPLGFIEIGKFVDSVSELASCGLMQHGLA